MTSYTGVPGLTAALRSLPRLATDELRQASVRIAAEVAAEAADAARQVGGVARHVAPTIKATRDRVPVVKMGGTGRLPPSEGHRTRGGSRQTVGGVIMGAEFGGQRRPTTRQFRPHRGTIGYFLWPAVRAHSDRTQALYSAALDDAMNRMR